MPKKKNKETKTAKPEATPQPSQSKVGNIVAGSLLAMAMDEPRRRELAEFSDIIGVLRNDKNFTFREIAQWIHEHTGFETDHNAVYREYTRGMPPEVAAGEALDDDHTEKEENGY